MLPTTPKQKKNDGDDEGLKKLLTRMKRLKWLYRRKTRI